MVVEADALVNVVHDRLQLSRRGFILAEHEDGRARAGDAAAEGAGGFALLLDLVKAGDQHAANGFDDDVFERAADQVIVVLNKSGDEARDVGPLADGVFEEHLFAQDLAGIGGTDFDLRVNDRDVQGGSRYGNDIEREDRADEGDAAIDTGRDVVGMFDAGGYFLAEEGEPDKVFIGEAIF